jgi:hypothetical protein
MAEVTNINQHFLRFQPETGYSFERLRTVKSPVSRTFSVDARLPLLKPRPSPLPA